MRQFLKQITPVRRLYMRYRARRGVRGQSNEGAILRSLADSEDAPRTFIEFGFHPVEFNCATLIDDYAGLLIDGSADQVADATAILPHSVAARQSFITLDNLDWIADWFSKVGVLSIDVDGNDYWFLERLVAIEPTIICVEYNASMLGHSITVPYDPAFDRREKHASGWYHGASLKALTKLCARHGYGLAAVADAGGNAFYTKSGTLDPEIAWRPTKLRDAMASMDAIAQWRAISEMPFVEI